MTTFLQKALFFLIANFTISFSLGCNCSSLSFYELVEKAEIVLIGAVSEKEDSLEFYCKWNGNEERKEHAEMVRHYKINVSHQFKGDFWPSIILRTSIGGGSCGINAELGDELLICMNKRKIKNAFHGADSIWVPFEDYSSICDGSMNTEYLSEDEVKLLNEKYNQNYYHSASFE